MTQIFADLSSMQDGILAIGGEDYNHIKNVLRMHAGEKISVWAQTETAASIFLRSSLFRTAWSNAGCSP